MSKKFSDWINKVEPKEEKEEVKAGQEKAEEKQEAINYEERYKRFESFDHPEFDELASLIQSEPGETFGEKVNAFKSKGNIADEYKTLKEKHEEREKWYRQNRITMSEEFVEKFDKPIAKARDIYTALIGEDDGKGNPRYEESYLKLRRSIWNDGGEMNASKLRALLKTFSEQYEKAYGVKPDLPSVKEILEAREDLVNASIARNAAIEDWEKISEEEAEKAKFQAREQGEIKKKNYIEENKKTFNDFKASNPLEKFADFIDEGEATELISKFESDFMEMISNPASRKVADYLDEGIKARAFDTLKQEYDKLKDYIEKKLGGMKGASTKGEEKQEVKKQEAGAKSVASFFGIH